MLFAALAGAATIATFAVTIVMGQEFLPGRIGVASGVTIGLSVGMGGVAAPLLGILADADGLRVGVRVHGRVPAGRAGALAGPAGAPGSRPVAPCRTRGPRRAAPTQQATVARVTAAE